jgi:hypothetical protein
MKIKYEQRLNDLKHEFEVKFKQNEKVWKKRLDYHKQIVK